eukprot:1249640-Amphidinium_carterae.2
MKQTLTCKCVQSASRRLQHPPYFERDRRLATHGPQAPHAIHVMPALIGPPNWRRARKTNAKRTSTERRRVWPPPFQEVTSPR